VTRELKVGTKLNVSGFDWTNDAKTASQPITKQNERRLDEEYLEDHRVGDRSCDPQKRAGLRPALTNCLCDTRLIFAGRRLW
jgi:hypothetical protein